jgi:hypothetical protein
LSVERIKTLILTVLIIICITLGVQIWFGEKLWSDDYDFFSVSDKNFFSFIFNKDNSTDITVTGAMDSVFCPRSAVLSYTDGRIIVNFTDPASAELREALNYVIKQALSSSETKVSESEWQSALTAKSVYADFSVLHSFNAMADFLGTKNTFSAFNDFDKMVIVTNSFSTSRKLPVYFCNTTTNEYLKTEILLEDQSLYQVQDAYSKKEKQNISYAFEMNLDEPINDANNYQKIIFDSYVIIHLDPVYLNIIEQSVLPKSEEKDIKRILEVFGVDYNSAKKYSHSNGTNLYVDKNCAITISPDGLISYEASDETKGFEVSKDFSVSSCAAGSAKLLDNLLSCYPISPNTRIFINSPLTETEGDKFTFNFDYLYNSTLIYSPNHSAEMLVKKGKLVNLKAYIKSFDLISQGKESNSLEVIDILYQSMGQKDIKINDLYFGYFQKDTETSLSWQAKIEGADEIIIIN